MTFLERAHELELDSLNRNESLQLLALDCWPEIIAVVEAASECRDERYIDDLQATVRALDKKAGEG